MKKSYKQQLTLTTEIKRKHKKKMKLIRQFGYWYTKNKSYFFCSRLKRKIQYQRILDLILRYIYTHRRQTCLLPKSLTNKDFSKNFQSIQMRLDVMLIRIHCCWTIKHALFLLQKGIVCFNNVRQTRIRYCSLLDKITIKPWIFIQNHKYLRIKNWRTSPDILMKSNLLNKHYNKGRFKRKIKTIINYRGFFNMRYGRTHAYLLSDWRRKNHIIINFIHPQESLTLNSWHWNFAGKKTAFTSRLLKSIWLMY